MSPARPEVTGRRLSKSTSAPLTLALADDVLVGAAAIAGEIGIPLRKCFHWLENGYLPATKTGATWTTTKTRLRRHFDGSEEAGA